MEVLTASSSVVTAASFLWWPPQKRMKTLAFMPNSPSTSHPKRRLDTSRISISREKLKMKVVNSIGSASYYTIMTSIVLGSGSSALAEEVVQLQEPSSTFGAEGLVNAVAAFLDKYPLFAFGVSFVVFLVIPLVSDLADRSKKWVSAETAYSILKDEVESQLVDIRGIYEIADVGSPDISSFNKEVVQVTYTGDEDAFLYEMRKRFKEPVQTTLYILAIIHDKNIQCRLTWLLDMYDGNSMEVAQMLMRNGFKAVYAIRDGFLGSNGWQAVGEVLFPKTVLADSRNGATVSQDHKVNVSGSAVVDTEDLQIQTKESTKLPSSFGTEARITSASQTAAVEPAVEPLSSIRPLSPYTVYPDLKPPTSPTPSKPTSKPEHVVTNDGSAISDLKVDVSNAATEFAPAEPVAKASFLSRPLSPYPQYPDLKPPTSPTPSKPTGKTIGFSNNAATLSDQNIDVSTQTIKSASVLFSFQSPPIKPASETPSLPRSLSPYPQYADLKPPTSPTPSKPIFKTVDAGTNSSATISIQKVDASSPTTKSAAVSSSLGGEDGVDLASQSALVGSSTEIPCLSRPLSPYPQYADLKPPTSPTPSKPTFKTVDAVVNSSATISNQKVDASSATTKSAAVLSSFGGGDGIDLASQSSLVGRTTEIPCFSRPLSPYPQYPDLKPPTSPTPSRP